MRKFAPRDSITADEFRMFLACYRAGDNSALAELVKGMLRFFHFIAKEWGRLVDEEDLVQECVCIFLEVLPKIKDIPGAKQYALLNVRDKIRHVVPDYCSMFNMHKPWYNPATKKMTTKLVHVKGESLSFEDYRIHRLLYRVSRKDA